VQNELARLGVDVLNTQGHNERLQQALDMLDAELKDKVGGSWCCLDSCSINLLPSSNHHNDYACLRALICA
jgi:hypothetical protein